MTDDDRRDAIWRRVCSKREISAVKREREREDERTDGDTGRRGECLKEATRRFGTSCCLGKKWERNPSEASRECRSDKLLSEHHRRYLPPAVVPPALCQGEGGECRASRQTSFKCALKFHQLATSRKPSRRLNPGLGCCSCRIWSGPKYPQSSCAMGSLGGRDPLFLYPPTPSSCADYVHHFPSPNP